jgi:signal transduction histidine kinase
MPQTSSFRMTLPLLAEPRHWWHSLERTSKVMGAVCAVVVCGAVYACSVVASHIEAAFTQKAAASTALYMDSFVEPLVQELAASNTLSIENRQALEHLVSPLAMVKPIVALRIWLGDHLVFSNPRASVGETLPPPTIRDRALNGEVVANFAQTAEDALALPGASAPILEIYAPIRQTGSNRVIALAATSELAVELSRETRAAQYSSYVVIASAASTLLLVLFNLTASLQKRIGELSLQQAADERFRKRVCRANGRVFEINERNLRRVGRQLHAGPLQLAALALLKVDSLSEPAADMDDVGSERANDIDAIRKALRECLQQIRDLSASLAPAELDGLCLAETIKKAVRLHELRTLSEVACDLRDLPQRTTEALNACAYQFVSQGLSHALQHGTGAELEVRATGSETLEIELCYEVQRARQVARLAHDVDLAHENLRQRIEALGGSLLVHSEADRHLRISARFGAAGTVKQPA